LAFSFII